MTENGKDAALDGISVNGVAVSELVDRQEAEEIEAVRREELAEQRKQLQAKFPMAFEMAAAAERARKKYYTNKYVPHRRCVKLSPTQIRKEYGVMSMPHATKLANVLDCLRLSTKPLSNAELIEMTGYTQHLVTQYTSEVFRYVERLPGLRTERTTSAESDRVRLRYWIDEAVWPDVQSLIDSFNRIKRQERAGTVAAPRKAEPATQPKSLFSAVADLFGAELEKALGVKVEVSGRVEIVIKVEAPK